MSCLSSPLRSAHLSLSPAVASVYQQVSWNKVVHCTSHRIACRTGSFDCTALQQQESTRRLTCSFVSSSFDRSEAKRIGWTCDADAPSRVASSRVESHLSASGHTGDAVRCGSRIFVDCFALPIPCPIRIRIAIAIASHLISSERIRFLEAYVKQSSLRRRDASTRLDTSARASAPSTSNKQQLGDLPSPSIFSLLRCSCRLSCLLLSSLDSSSRNRRLTRRHLREPLAPSGAERRGAAPHRLPLGSTLDSTPFSVLLLAFA